MRAMNTKQVVKYFGGRDKAIQALGIYRQVWDYWVRAGIPIGRQYEIQVRTQGALTVDKLKARA